MKLKNQPVISGAPCQSAFTIMEAVIAMVVVGVLAIGLYGGMTWATFSVRLARENLRATQILVEKAEVLRTFSWDQITSAGFVPTNFTAPYFSDGTTNLASGLIYTGTVAISQIPSGGPNYSNDMRVVTLNL